MANTIAWIEFNSNSQPETESFFNGAFDWQFQPMGDSYQVYEVPGAQGGLTSGGFGSGQSANAQPTVVYIGVEDIEDTLRRVEAAGGTKVKDKTSIGEHGNYGLFKDPHGVLWGVWSKH